MSKYISTVTVLILSTFLLFVVGGQGNNPHQVKTVYKAIYMDFSTYPDDPVKTRGIIGWNLLNTEDKNGKYPGLKLTDDSELVARFSFASLPEQAVLFITHRFSKKSPITVSINGTPVISNKQVIARHGGSQGYQTDTFEVTEHIKMGENTITWQVGHQNTPYYLREFRIEARGPAREKTSYIQPSQTTSFKLSAAAPRSNLGFATGGAKDIQNFRKNIQEGYLPLPTDIPYEGLFYDYYFETGQEQPCNQLFCPSYSLAVTDDPLSGKTEYYMTVGLNSNLSEETFKRKKLNLVVVLDISGSMSSSFDEYYYDRFGNKVQAEDWNDKQKIEAAKEALTALVSHLRPEDKLGIVLYNNKAYKLRSVTTVGPNGEEEVREDISWIRADGGTNLESGMYMASRMMDQFENADKSIYENRVVLITDMMPNIGTISKSGLGKEMKHLADNGIYTSFVGVGVDFNTELTEAISKIKGANSFSIHSAKEFKDKMSKDFEYMVTPLVFDLQLELASSGYDIQKVYGSTAADESTGKLMKVRTLFPSRTKDGKTKGGVVLVKLLRDVGNPEMTLRVTYETRESKKRTVTRGVTFEDRNPEYFENSGIRKAVLLARYADLMKNWIIYERNKLGYSVSPESLEAASKPGIEPFVKWPGLNQWERLSLDLRVSKIYEDKIEQFIRHFKSEMKVLKDDNLGQELEIMEELINH